MYSQMDCFALGEPALTRIEARAVIITTKTKRPVLILIRTGRAPYY